MPPTTEQLWAQQDRLVGDRSGLYAAVASATEAHRVLYPGSYVDIAPSFVFADVTYVDVDRRAARFFDDEAGVRAIVGRHRSDADRVAIRFLPADYSEPLDVADESVDLLVSLYAGFVSDHCTRHLRVGGSLFVNSSHGDAALASIDERYALGGVVHHRAGTYRVDTEALDEYLVPKRSQPVTRDLLLESGRGIAYTRPAFAYLFVRTT